MDFVIDSLKETLSSPTDLFLLGVIGFIIYRVFLRKDDPYADLPPPPPQLPPMPKRDFTNEQLLPYDGTNEEGRILMAVLGTVYDVTRAKNFYGKDGAYGVFGGHDATRGLATFQMSQEAVKDTYDDVSDLGAYEMESVKEWKQQFDMKYPIVGRLLKPGEEPQEYSEEEKHE